VNADPATLVALLRGRAAEQPDTLAYRFLLDGESAEARLTYAELDSAARSIAVRLADAGGRHERALLLYPPGLDYITAFFGCLYAGTVAVPAYPPNPSRLADGLDRLRGIADDARPAVTLTTSAGLAAVAALAAGGSGPWPGAQLATDEIPATDADSWRPPALDGDSVAFIQYTSGSTTTPRGVVLSHANLLHNSGQIHRFFGNSPDSRAVAWLPPYHDMGLIGGILQPLYGGFPITLMSPTAFLERPLRWLAAISRYGATASGGPNFAYDLCVRKTSPQDRAGLDLGSWRVAFNGAEPIRMRTLELFAAAFAPYGFRREAFLPCYGLAEATLIVTGGAPWKGDERRVSCGSAAPDQRLAIVDPVSKDPRPIGEEGEIWVAGPSVATGYWERPDLSREVFQAHIDRTGEGPFLRTGDLGYLRDGALVVTGRLKDLIIVRGRNHYPQDIEATAEASHPALRPGCGAAFAAGEGENAYLVVAWEVDPRAGDVDPAVVARAVRTDVARDHDLQVRTVVLLPRGGIHKTSSGKVQRGRCAALFAAGDLAGQHVDVSGAAPGSTAGGAGRLDRARLVAAPPATRGALLYGYMRHQVAAACGVADDDVDPAQPLLALGADSLAVVTLGQMIEADLGVALSVSALVDAASLVDIVRRLEDELARAATATAPRAATDAVLTHGQRALWFLHQLDPGGSAHHIAVALRLRGPLDTVALRRALDTLVTRHAVLRTTFESRDGEPVARVAATGTSAIREHTGTEADLAGSLADAANEPFDLATGPLLRVDLHRVGPDETVVLVVAHHAITDFWSMSTLVDELETLYGTGAEPPPPAAAYADVAAFQERSLTGERGRALRAYWSEELRDASGDLRLPPREGTAAAVRAGAVRLRIDEALTRRIKQSARAEGVTPYMVLLAAYQLLLHRYTGQDDLLVGTPVAGRERPEFARVVGYCMNPVAIRSRLDGTESVREILAQVRRRVAGALSHQTYPLDLLDRERHAGEPLFRAMFVYNRPPVRGAAELALLAFAQPGIQRQFAGLVAEPVEVAQYDSAADLQLSVAEIDGALFASLQYRTEVVDGAVAESMTRHFTTILTAMTAAPEQPAHRMDMLSPDERRRLLTEWCATASRYEPDATVVELVERRVTAEPDAVAVIAADGTLSYRELNERANRVAHLLAGRGSGPGARVGLHLDRTPGLIVAMLAVLKAGAAYVPVDPAHPRDRVAGIFREAGVTVVLSQRELAGTLPEGTATILIDDPAAVAGQPSADSDQTVGHGGTAYVMYTSGSTGRPKGVVVGHRSLANYVRHAVDDFNLSPGDRVLQFASPAFDTSAQEIYTTLAAGAALVLRDDRMLSSPGAFLDQCARWSITVLDLPTAYWHELVVALGQGAASLPAGLRLVIIGGERAAADLTRAWHEHAGDRVRLVNDYGPTEATIVAVTGDLTGHAAAGEVPIGRPVPGARAYVLDAMRQPVPAGVVGELYLGGAGLAHGYLDRPGLTAQVFVPDPFHAGARLYRTGDLASFTAGGELVFRGRADRQVKLRGYRVEPAEIESVLRALPGVADAFVHLRDEPRQLVGYVVGAGGTAPNAADLRAALRGRLPEYMVPTALVTTPAFPRNANGKVDVTALPAPPAAGAGGKIAPRTPVERFLVETFADVLGITGVGVDDDFFALGGHSLLATRLLARIADRFAVDLPLRAVFEAPTPAGLAELIAQAPPATAGPTEAPPLVPVPRDQPLPLSFVQEGIWFLQLMSPGTAAYNVPRALRIRGDFDAAIVAQTFAELEQRHEILRTTFPDVDGEPVQVVHPPRGIPLTVIELTDVPDAERDDRIQQMIVAAGRAPFDLATGPLIRVTLLPLAADEHVLIVIEHHLVHDGWAQGVFLRDFLEVYQAKAAGRPPRLPDLPVQFADYAYWQRQVIRGATLDRLIDFWTEELAGAPHLLALPTDRPHPPKLTFAGGLETLVIDGELGTTLRRFSRERGATLFMTMFSAFTTLLYRHSGQEDILVGVGMANRRRPEAENLLGMLINTVVVRARMSGEPGFAELVERVRETCLRVYPHQDLPFEKLVQALRPKRSTARMPLCQVLFTFLDTPMPRLEIPGLTLEAVAVHNRTAKFDLNVVVQIHAEQWAGAGSRGNDAEEAVTVLWEYNADVFDRETIRRMLDEFRAVLVAALDEPDRPLPDFLPELGPKSLTGARPCD
jgi:amino acid adenylation domain-containing protein